MSVFRGFVRGVIPCAMVLALVANVRDADACGGCFHLAAEQGSSVITDHRMVFKISATETVLWDQVRYAGDPEEFAWVLPVTAGARIEISRDEWISALDNASRTTVTGPEVFCNGGGSSSSSGGGGGGGGCMGSAETTSAYSDESARGSADAGTHYTGNEDVQVVGQKVIGPYQAVTIHPTDEGGVTKWLTSNGFAIPPTVTPIIDAYTRERFDFIALRLRPGVGIRAMRPVRVVSPGASAVLPLRMVAAGVGSHVGLTLWVLGEGRWQTGNFATTPIDYGRLAWDGAAGRSNLSTLQANALAANGGRSWISEAAVRTTGTSSTSALGALPSLYDAYIGSCRTRGPRTVPCDDGELPPADGKPRSEDVDPPDGGDDAGIDDAGDAGADADAGTKDASPPDPPACTKTLVNCDGYDDLEVAMRGLHPGDVWISRLRADLPSTALDTDLVLQAAPDQTEDSPRRHTEKFTLDSFDPCNGRGLSNGASSSSSDDDGGCACRVRGSRTEDAGTFFLVAVAGLGAIAVSRTSRRRR